MEVKYEKALSAIQPAESKRYYFPVTNQHSSEFRSALFKAFVYSPVPLIFKGYEATKREKIILYFTIDSDITIKHINGIK